MQEFYKSVRLGLNDIQLADINFNLFARCLKAIDRIRLATMPSLNKPREVILLVGLTGLGKTKSVFAQYGQDVYELPMGTYEWFDGYQGQRVILADEFDGQMTLDVAKKFFDPHYVRKVAIKGGFTWLTQEITIATSNNHPATWYKGFSKSDKPFTSDRSESERALRRRFDAILHFTAEGIVPYVGQDAIKNFWPIGDEIIPIISIPLPVAYQTVLDPNPTRTEMNHFESNMAQAEDPYISSDEDAVSEDVPDKVHAHELTYLELQNYNAKIKYEENITLHPIRDVIIIDSSSEEERPEDNYYDPLYVKPYLPRVGEMDSSSEDQPNSIQEYILSTYKPNNQFRKGDY